MATHDDSPQTDAKTRGAAPRASAHLADHASDQPSGLPTDTSRPARVGMWVIGLGLGGFLLWAGFAPLEEGVPTAGSVAIDTKRRSIQHASGGIVNAVYVKEGQFVRTGDPLLRIDEVATQANHEAVRNRYLTLRAMEGRLVAEQLNRATIDFHPDLLAEASDPTIQKILDNQKSLLQSRRGALLADTQATREAIEGQAAAVRGGEDMLTSRQLQLQHLQEELAGLREMVREGYAPRNRLLELERTAAATAGAVAELKATVARGRHAMSELRLRAQQRAHEYRKEVDAQLADIRREVQADGEKLKAVRDELTRVMVRSPADGQVVNLAVGAAGRVIASGQVLMDIVPQHETLLLEARVPPHMIDRVHSGKEADVRFSAFAHSPSLVAQGRVDSVSSDLITDPNTLATYYLARVSLTPEGMQSLGKRQMQAGMPTEVIIKTGERTLLNYLLNPLLKRVAASLKEE